MSGTMVYRVRRSIPEIGARAGDYLVVQPDHPTLPFVIKRQVPLALLGVVMDPENVEPMPPKRWAASRASPRRPRPRGLQLMG